MSESDDSEEWPDGAGTGRHSPMRANCALTRQTSACACWPAPPFDTAVQVHDQVRAAGDRGFASGHVTQPLQPEPAGSWCADTWQMRPP